MEHAAIWIDIGFLGLGRIRKIVNIDLQLAVVEFWIEF